MKFGICKHLFVWIAIDEPKKDGDFQEIKGKKVQGFGFGNIFGGGPIKLKNKGASVKKVGPPETAERKVFL